MYNNFQKQTKNEMNSMSSYARNGHLNKVQGILNGRKFRWRQSLKKNGGNLWFQGKKKHSKTRRKWTAVKTIVWFPV